MLSVSWVSAGIHGIPMVKLHTQACSSYATPAVIFHAVMTDEKQIMPYTTRVQ